MTARFDFSTTKKWKKDKRGRLIVEATPTRAGIFTYYERDDNGGIKKVRELRHPDDVFSRETMDSLEVIPYTTQENHVSLMTPEDVRNKTYGTTMSNAKRVDDHANIKIKINDAEEIKAVMSGESLELSNGYECDIIKESGEYNGERYDQRQTNIIYDHVARVEKARGGNSCRIRLDSQDAISGIEAERLDSGNNSHKEEKMTEKVKEVILEKDLPARASGDFRLDADSVKIPQEQAGLVTAMLGREEKLFSALEKSNSENTEKQVKLDSQEKEIKDLKIKIENSIPSDRVDGEIERRSLMYSVADKMGIKDFKTMDIKSLESAMLKKSDLGFDESRFDSDEYRGFAFDLMMSDANQKKIKSRQNLETHKEFKFDTAYEDNISKPSRLEVS